MKRYYPRFNYTPSEQLERWPEKGVDPCTDNSAVALAEKLLLGRVEG